MYLNLLCNSLFFVPGVSYGNGKFWPELSRFGNNDRNSNFKTFSVSSNNSPNSLQNKEVFPTVLWNEFFTRTMIFSNWPLHHGTLLRLNLHCILLMLKIWLNAFDLFKYFTHLNDATNAFALSEYFFSGTALCDMNLLKALMNSLVVWFCMNSKLISLIRIHVNSNIYDFFSLRILFYILLILKNQELCLEILLFLF